jgi:CDP-glycerol glycerophosphotransferase (TagB/SpsB family)
MKKLLKIILSILFYPLKFLNLKKEFIVIQSFDPNIYSDNSKFLYEYISKKKDMKIFWYTKNIVVQNYLKNKNFQYINNKNILSTIWVTLKTKVVIDSGSSYFNFLNLLSNDTVKICLGHGIGSKLIKFKYIGSNKYETYKQFDYVNFTSDFAIKHVAINNYKLISKNILKFGYPRIEELKKKKLSKPMLKYLIGSSYKNKKILYYTPTWRPYNYNLPLTNLKNFNLKKFDFFLNKNNFLFFYTINTANVPTKLEINKFKNIIFIDRHKKPLFDTTSFLKEIDILINDCSTTTTECSILKKPQIHIFPDLKKYKSEVGFLIDYKKNMPGPLCNDYDSFIKKIMSYSSSRNKYIKKYEIVNKRNLKNFYDIYNKNSNYLFYKFLKKILFTN